MSGRGVALGGGAVSALGVGGAASARDAAGSPTRLNRRWSHDRSGTPVVVNRSNRSATDRTTVGTFHVFPQTNRTSGGAPKVESAPAFSASVHSGRVRSCTLSIGGSGGEIVASKRRSSSGSVRPPPVALRGGSARVGA